MRDESGVRGQEWGEGGSSEVRDGSVVRGREWSEGRSGVRGWSGVS